MLIALLFLVSINTEAYSNNPIKTGALFLQMHDDTSSSDQLNLSYDAAAEGSNDNILTHAPEKPDPNAHNIFSDIAKSLSFTTEIFN